jgi:hypothetical protein
LLTKTKTLGSWHSLLLSLDLVAASSKLTKPLVR